MSEPTPGDAVAVRPASTSSGSELARHTDSWAEMAGPVFRLAAQIADTEFVPKALQGNAPAVAAAILHGRELGLGPMTALAQTHVIEGRSSISAEGQRAQVLAAGHEIEFVESTGSICRVRGRRKGSETWTAVSWSIDMAKAAGLANKSNWRNYPRRMLQARASAELCQMIFPDVLHGISATEELEDAADATSGQPVVQTTTVARKGRKLAELPPPDPTPEPALSAPDEPPSVRGRQGGPQTAGEGTTVAGTDDTSASERPSPAPPAEAQPEPTLEVDAGPPKATNRQVQMLQVLWQQLGVTDRDEKLGLTSVLIDREVGSTNDLRKHEATGLINRLSKLGHDVLGDGATLDQLDEVTVRRLRAALDAEVARVQDERAGE